MTARHIGWLVRRRWWLILAPALAAAVGAGAWAWQRPTVYASEGSYVVQVRVADQADLVRGTAALTSTDEVVSTYAGVAQSSLIAGRARRLLGLSRDEGAEVEVTSSVVPDANVVLIGARSSDPHLALEMAAAAGDLTQAYVREHGVSFRLTDLDPAREPEAASGRPAPGLVGGAALVGVAAGFALAAAAERGASGQPRRRLRDIVDEQSGAYAMHYFLMRLDEEVARSRRTGRPFSVGVLQVLRRRPEGDEVEEPARLTDTELKAVGAGISRTLREQDILGHLGHGRFAAILPDLDVGAARTLVQRWRRSPAPALLRFRRGRDYTVKVAACGFEGSGFIGDADAELIVGAL